MPYRSRPPTRSARSNTVTSWPARVSCCAAASPAGPDPTTATRWAVRTCAATGSIHPSSHARSTISTSTCLIVTGSWLMPSTHADSHGAGHSRPVNSGKLFVACRRSLASSQSSRHTRSFHSGMMLPSGQAWWQNGIPQSMQRPACLLMIGSSARPRPPGYTSFQSCTRSSTGRREATSRPSLRKPRGSAMERLHHLRCGLVVGEIFFLGLLLRGEDQLVLSGHHLGEPACGVGPVGQQGLGHRRPGLLVVPAYQLSELFDDGTFDGG